MSRRLRGVGAQHEQRRTEIADAVLAIVDERGLAAVSLTEVAAQAGISPGRVQHYFPAKQQLISAAFERGNELSSARIKDRVGATLDRADPRLVLTTVLTELIPSDAATEAHLRVRQSFTALALADEAIAARLRVLYDDFHRQMTDLLRAGQQAGHISAAHDPHQTALSLVALAEGLASYVLINVTTADAARDCLLTAVSELYGGDEQA